MKSRAIVLFFVICVFVLSAAVPALGDMHADANKPKPFHDDGSPAFANVHVKYKICAEDCHMDKSGHQLCGTCHDLAAECGACHEVPED